MWGGCSALCPEADSPSDPTASMPLARTSPRDQPPPLAQAPAVAPALAEAGSCCPGSCRAPGPCQQGLQPGDRELPEPRKVLPRGAYLITHPGRAGRDRWRSEPSQPLEIRAARHSMFSREGFRGTSPPDKTPFHSPGTYASA